MFILSDVGLEAFFFLSFFFKLSSTFSFVLTVAPSRGACAGLLCIWDTLKFQVHRHFVGDRFILLEGTWLENGVIVANAYLLCKLRNKKKLWDELRGRRALLGVGVWLETLIALEGWRKVLEMMMALTLVAWGKSLTIPLSIRRLKIYLW